MSSVASSVSGRSAPGNPARRRPWPKRSPDRLAGAGVADEEHVLAPLDVLTASQLAERAALLTEGRARKSKPSSVLWVGRCAALDVARRPCVRASSSSSSVSCEQVGEVVGVVGGRLAGELLALGCDRRQAQCLGCDGGTARTRSAAVSRPCLLTPQELRKRARLGGSMANACRCRRDVQVQGKQRHGALGALR